MSIKKQADECITKIRLLFLFSSDII